VSGIYFCDGSSFTHGNSLDISGDGISFLTKGNGTEQMNIYQSGKVSIQGGQNPDSFGYGWLPQDKSQFGPPSPYGTGDPSGSGWRQITSSSDGIKLAGIQYPFPISYPVADASAIIWTSTDAGANWSALNPTPNRTWTDITSSSDGSKLAATSFNLGYGIRGKVSTSINAGLTWVDWDLGNPQLPSTGGYECITSSEDGMKLFVIDSNCTVWTYNATLPGWYSAVTSPTGGLNPGNITPPNTLPFVPTVAITSSSYGTKLAAAVYGGGIWTSTDFGKNWYNKTGTNREWTDITSSSDGTKLAAVEYDGGIWTSIDAGENWTVRNPIWYTYNIKWTGITSSSDGSKLAATQFVSTATGAVGGGEIWTSTDAGVSWKSMAPPHNGTGTSGLHKWYGITSSSDGARLAAVINKPPLELPLSISSLWTRQYLGPTILDVSGSLHVQGDITATGDIVSNFTSDIRFKTNIKKIKNPLEKLSKINGYTYNWIDSDLHPYNGEDTGVIAQEVETIDLPGVTVTRESGYKGVKYERLIPLLLESIKSLQETYIKQQNQINQLMENKLLKN